MLEARFLGQFDARLGGRPVAITSRPAQSLFAFVVMHPNVQHRREKLAAMLWPDATESSARRNLRQALYALRRTLRPGAEGLILADEISMRFVAQSEFWLDAAELQRKLPDDAPLEAWVAAVSLYAGELLPGFYEDWVAHERQRLAGEFDHKISRVLDQLTQQGHWADVRHWAERWIALGQSPEPAFRALMLAHAGQGDLSGVAAVYERCIAALGREIGVAPSEQTRKLYERLARGEPVIVSRAAPAAPPAADAAPAPGRPPFKGLQPFEEADADLFFGRESLVAALVARLEHQNFLAVVGASGSGKSSLVRAGVIPALRGVRALADGVLPPASSLHWPIHVLTPTAHPLEALAVCLTRGTGTMQATAALMDDLAREGRSLRLWVRHQLEQAASAASRHGPRRLLLVVDQFEELFTLCRDESERRALIDNLLAAVADDAAQVSVVITLRADFYAHCAQHALLRDAVAANQVFIGPLQPAELRRAVEAPAANNGWDLEEGLVDLILRDVGDEPGTLPLLSHALHETWKARRGRTLTLQGYAAAGGVRGALAQTAERVYRELGPRQQAIARSIFLRLTELGDGTQDTRRRASRDELLPRLEHRALVDEVLTVLVEARLVTTSAAAGLNAAGPAATVEVAHEALIREWPTLRRWLEEDRDGLRLQRHLTEAAQEWDRFGRDPGELYRGARLAQSLEWAAAHGERLNALEHQFLEAARAHAHQEALDREAQRQRELEAAAALAASESGRAETLSRAAAQLRRRALHLGAALALALIMALAAAFFAVQAEQSALAAQANFTRSEAQRLAAEANTLLQTGGNSELIALLAIRSMNIQYTPQGDVALTRANTLNFPRQLFLGHTDTVQHVDVSPDGARLLTASSDGTVRLWELATGQELRQFAAHAAPVTSVAFSPDGRRAVSGSEDGAVYLSEVETGRPLRRLAGHNARVTSVSFAPDGQRVAAGSSDETVLVWDVETGAVKLKLDGRAGAVWVLFSPDGRRLLTGANDGTARLWDATTGTLVQVLAGHSGSVYGLDFSADGRFVLTGSVDRTARLWDADTGQEVRRFEGHSATIYEVALSPDGRLVATASEDRTTIVWDASTGQPLQRYAGHTASVLGVAFSPDSRWLVTASADNTARLWDTAPPAEVQSFQAHQAQIWGVAYSPDGQYIATSSVDRTARLWEAQTGREVRRFVGHTAEIYGIAFAPDGQQLLTAGLDGTARLWEVSTGQQLRQLSLRRSQPVAGVAFSPDGRYAVTTGDDRLAHLWNLETGRHELAFAGHTAGLNLTAFSPDGRYLATAGSDSTARLWDVETGQIVHTLAGHSGFVSSVAFSPDGSLLATASADKTARLWDVATGQELRRLSGHAGLLWGVAFSPDGRWVVTVSADATARVWDAQTGLERRRLSGRNAALQAVAVAPDGERIVAVSDDGSVHFWDLEVGRLVQRLCAQLLRDFTPEERQQYDLTGDTPTCPAY